MLKSGLTKSAMMYLTFHLDSQGNHHHQQELQVHRQLHHHAESWLWTQHFRFMFLGQRGRRNSHHQVGCSFPHLHRQRLRLRSLIHITIILILQSSQIATWLNTINSITPPVTPIGLPHLPHPTFSIRTQQHSILWTATNCPKYTSEYQKFPEALLDFVARIEGISVIGDCRSLPFLSKKSNQKMCLYLTLYLFLRRCLVSTLNVKVFRSCIHQSLCCGGLKYRKYSFFLKKGQTIRWRMMMIFP